MIFEMKNLPSERTIGFLSKGKNRKKLKSATCRKITSSTVRIIKGRKFEKSPHFDKIETIHRVGKYCHWQQCIAVRSADMITSWVLRVITVQSQVPCLYRWTFYCSHFSNQTSNCTVIGVSSASRVAMSAVRIISTWCSVIRLLLEST